MSKELESFSAVLNDITQQHAGKQGVRSYRPLWNCVDTTATASLDGNPDLVTGFLELLNDLQSGDPQLIAAEAFCHAMLKDFTTAAERFRSAGALSNLLRGRKHLIGYSNHRFRNLASVARTASREEGNTPSFVIAGFLKCGSTTLSRTLSGHSRLRSSIPTETQYFSKNLNYACGMDWYRACFRSPMFSKSEQIYFEKTPGYISNPHAMERLARDLPENLKVVYIVRHPVKRAFSQYRNRAIRNQHENSIDDFRQTMLRDHAEYHHNSDCSPAFRKSPFFRSCYFNNISETLKFIDKRRVFIISLEEIMTGSEGLRRLFEFLDIDHQSVTIKRENIKKNVSQLDSESIIELSKLYREDQEQLFNLAGRQLY